MESRIIKIRLPHRQCLTTERTTESVSKADCCNEFRDLSVEEILTEISIIKNKESEYLFNFLKIDHIAPGSGARN